MRRTWIPALALGADVVAVVVFAAIGRASHAEAGGVLGVLATAFPFVVGAVVAQALPRVRTAPASPAAGVAVLAASVVVGLALRWGFTGRLPWSFALVTVLVLGALMLGWRALSWLVSRGVRPGSRQIPGG